MAPELLASSDRHSPADVFSLALTLYEMCILSEHRLRAGAGLSPLQSGGPDWHLLRNGDAPPLMGRGDTLRSIIRAAMDPSPAARPSTETILASADMADAMRYPDALLQSASAPSLGPTLCRVPSFVLSMDNSLNPSPLPPFRSCRNALAWPRELNSASVEGQDRRQEQVYTPPHSAWGEGLLDTCMCGDYSNNSFARSVVMTSSSAASELASAIPTCTGTPIFEGRMDMDSSHFDRLYEGSLLDESPRLMFRPQVTFHP
jgi:serine/threonine protein kinase